MSVIKIFYSYYYYHNNKIFYEWSSYLFFRGSYFHKIWNLNFLRKWAESVEFTFSSLKFGPIR